MFVNQGAGTSNIATVYINGTPICSPTINLTNYQLVTNYSYIYGPITQYNDGTGNGWTYQFWNSNCSIQTTWNTTSSLNSGEVLIYQN